MSFASNFVEPSSNWKDNSNSPLFRPFSGYIQKLWNPPVIGRATPILCCFFLFQLTFKNLMLFEFSHILSTIIYLFFLEKQALNFFHTARFDHCLRQLFHDVNESGSVQYPLQQILELSAVVIENNSKFLKLVVKAHFPLCFGHRWTQLVNVEQYNNGNIANQSLFGVDILCRVFQIFTFVFW